MNLPFLRSISCLLLLTTILEAAEPTFHGKTFAEWKVQVGKGTSQERGRAAMALGLGPFGKDSIPVLLKALNEKDAHVRHCVVTALGEIGPAAKEAGPLLARMLGTKAEDEALCIALGRIGLDAEPNILDIFSEKGVSVWNMSNAFSGGVPDSLPIVARGLVHESRHVRFAADNVCSSPERVSAALVTAIIAALKEQKNAEGRDSAIRCLGLMGPRAEAAIPLLTSLLEHQAEAGEAGAALGRIGKPALPVLRRILDSGPPAARQGVLRGLHPDWEGALPLVLARLDDTNEATRNAAWFSLENFALDLGPHLPRLVKHRNDPDPVISTTVYQVLACLRPRTDETVHLLALGLLDEAAVNRDQVDVLLSQLPEIPDVAAVVLIRALKDRREFIRLRAVKLLAFSRAGNLLVLRALREALDDVEPIVRMEAAQSLGHLGPAVRRFHMSHPQTTVECVVPALQARLRDNNDTVRLCVASALCQIGYSTEAAIAEIARRLADPPEMLAPDLPLIITSYHVPLHPRAAAIESLRRSGSRGAIAVPLLVKGLQHEHAWVRGLACESLGALGAVARPAVPALARLLVDSDSYCRRTAIKALATIGHEAIPILLRALEGKETALKLEICEWARGTQPTTRPLIPAVERLVFEPDGEVRELAIAFLLNAGAQGEPLKKGLVRLLEATSEGEREWACEGLGKFGARAAGTIPQLKLRLLDSSREVRIQAAHTLACVDSQGKKVLLSLLELLKERDATIRRAAVAALGHLGPVAKRVLPQIQTALKDSSEEVRLEAALSLWRITGKKDESMLTLKNLYRDGRGGKRVEALKAMRQIEKRRDQLDMLMRLLADEDDTTRGLAETYAESLEPEVSELVPAVRALTGHRAYGVRRTAYNLLDSLAAKKENQ
jgi:HEAT repeat protein